MSNLIALVRDAHEKMQAISSESDQIHTERDLSQYSGGSFIFGGGWNPERTMKVIPLEEAVIDTISQDQTVDYSSLPEHLKQIFASGRILQTSQSSQTDYSVLMSVEEGQSGEPPTGRTGALLYKGEPVTVSIDGKDFIVEIKGVGPANGDNSITQAMSRSSYFGSKNKRWGGLEVSEGEREHRNLETARNENGSTFTQGNSSRSAGLIVYKGNVAYDYGEAHDQAYLIRLSPSTIRASFNHNPNLPADVDKPTYIARCMGQQFAELMSLDSVLIHNTAHPENLVRTNNGYSLTDFADMRMLRELEDPYDLVHRTLEHVNEVAGVTDDSRRAFYQAIADGIGFNFNQTDEVDHTAFVDTLWREYLAPKVFEARKSDNIPYQKAARDLDEHGKSAVELEEEIKSAIPEKITDYSERREGISKRIGELKSRMNELYAVGTDGAKARTMYRFGFSSDQDALDYIQTELDQKIPWLAEAEQEYESLGKKIEGLQTAEENIQIALDADSGLEPYYLRSMMNVVTNYLQNEIKVLSGVDSQEAKENLGVAQSNLELAESQQKKPFELLQNLKSNPSHIRDMIRLPYNS